MAGKGNSQDLRIISEITKAEPQPDGSLLVEGVATSEAVDDDGELIDYPTAKAAMLDWRGNVREQHDPHKAVGRALEVLADDDAKQVHLKAMVSAGAPDTQAKVLDGTLKYFSIRGRASAKALDKVAKQESGKAAVRVFMKRISEVSLVDSGSNAEGEFAIVKAEGEQLLAVGLADDEVKADDKGKKPYGDVTYADPGYQSDGKKRYPIDTEAHIRAAWNYISKPKNARQYSSNQLSKIKGRIVGAWKKKIDSAGPPSAEEKAMQDAKAIAEKFVAKAAAMGIELTLPATVEKVGFDPQGYAWQGSQKTRDALQALYALAMIEDLVQRELAEPEDEAGQVAMLEQACSQIQEFIADELAEPTPALDAVAGTAVSMADDAGGVQKADGAPGAPAPAPTPVVKQDDTPPPEPGATPLAEPPVTDLEPVPAPAPAPAADTQKAVAVPAGDAASAGVPDAGLVEKLETLTGELAILKADINAKGEENTTLRQQVDVLKATVEKFGKRVVEPGTAVFKGPDGKPTTQPQGTADSNLSIPVGRLTEIVKAANGDLAVLHRELGLEIAQVQVRKALTGK